VTALSHLNISPWIQSA